MKRSISFYEDIYFYDFYPGLVFEREMVERLAKYGLIVDFDFYGRERGDAKPDSGQTAPRIPVNTSSQQLGKALTIS